MTKVSIYNFTYDKLTSFLEQHNINKFVSKQIFDWLYKKHVSSFEEMTNISKKNIQLLNDNFIINDLEEIKKEVDPEDETTKFLFKLEDGNKVESVIMKFDYGYSACVSSQVGCNMGCKFCASGRLKKVRNLEVNEMVLQILKLNKYLKETKNERLSSFVVMGIGEPFDNYNNLIDFLDIAKDRKAIEIGSRHITVSTSGLVHNIKKWADSQSQVNLAISLHAPNDTIRNQLMPVNSSYNIDQLMEAIDYYHSKNNRRITIEYLLIDGVNDQEQHAYELIKLLKNRLCYVNLIPYNAVDESGFKRSKNVKKFFDILNKHNITCTIRQERGKNISAACGQLRAKENSKV